MISILKVPSFSPKSQGSDWGPHRKPERGGRQVESCWFRWSLGEGP